MLLVGVKLDPKSDDYTNENLTGLIRIPSSRKSNYLTGLLKPKGIIANVIMTLIHIILIIAIPIFTPVISFFALSTMSEISEDIHAVPVTFKDFYMAD